MYHVSGILWTLLLELQFACQMEISNACHSLLDTLVAPRFSLSNVSFINWLLGCTEYSVKAIGNQNATDFLYRLVPDCINKSQSMFVKHFNVTKNISYKYKEDGRYRNIEYLDSNQYSNHHICSSNTITIPWYVSESMFTSNKTETPAVYLPQSTSSGSTTLNDQSY